MSISCQRQRLFAQQDDPLATAMAAFPSREREPFMTHWRGIRNDPNAFKKTIATDGKVAGWGRGIATRALADIADWLFTIDE